MEDEVILQVRNLHTHFASQFGLVKAVNGVAFTLKKGHILGLVGESGCGKTVTALSILRLIQWPGRILSGEVMFEGRDLLTLDDEEMRRIRGKDISLIFQDPASSLNPVTPIGAQVQEVISSHLNIPSSEAKHMAMNIMHQMGLPDPDTLAGQYSFQLSGGMAQRVMIAMATALSPKILIADEPTSALDVTIQAEILEELKRLRRERQASILLITHDMGVIAHMADDVAVMYGGTVVEQADVFTIFKTPMHPYTAALLATLPRLDEPRRQLRTIRGTAPNPVDLPAQCAFIPRCNKARNECRLNPRPPLVAIEDDHLVACYNPVRYRWDDLDN